MEASQPSPAAMPTALFSSIVNNHLFSAEGNLIIPSGNTKSSDSSTSTEQPPIQPDSNHDSLRSGGLNLPSILSNLFHLHPPSTKALPVVNQLTPTYTPKDNISSLCSAIHGSDDWSSLLDPLHPSLRHEILKYGELSQATYDAFDNNPTSEYHGSALYGRHRLLPLLGLSHLGYSITNYIYATSDIHLPHWLLRSKNLWCHESNWMGFVAVSGDAESWRIGCRDITVAWRGTVSPSEWLDDLQAQLEPLPGTIDRDDVRVERGFLSLYTSNNQSSRFTRTSASEQVMCELRRLVDLYKNKGEKVSVTITGHSLGGALALLNAAEAASLLPPDVAVTMISFAAPRVGNEAFGEMLKKKGVKILRVVTKQDVVPKVPGVVLHERRNGDTWDWVYAHVGDVLELDAGSSPYLKSKMVDIVGHHSLETYMHLVDGHEKAKGEFRVGAHRDLALVNKSTGLLREELGIPASWNQPENKGMVKNQFGRLVIPCRNPEDIPSPSFALSSSS